MTDAPSPSPLAFASEAALDLYFSADPLTLSDADHMRAIVELRRRRSEFASAEAAKSLLPKKARTRADTPSAPKAAALDKPASELSLGDMLDE